MPQKLLRFFLLGFGGLIIFIRIISLQVMPPAVAASTPDYFVYNDTLNWDDWSWGTTVNLNATSPVYAGTKSMAVTYNSGWVGLSLHNAGFNTSTYTHLQFYIFPAGMSVPNVKAILYNSSGPIKNVSIQTYSTSLGTGWYRITIPLADLGGANTTITRITLQEYSGSSQPTFYIDSLGFVNQSAPIPTPTSTPAYPIYDDILHWDNWSWNTTINTSASSPVYVGTKSMAVTYNQAWAGLYLHNPGFSTSSYSQFSFVLFPSAGQPGPNTNVSLYDKTGVELTRVNASIYAASLGNGWYQVSIPLADLGGSNITITGVQLQDNSGSSQATFYMDDIKFTGQGVLMPTPTPSPTPPPASDPTLPLTPQPGFRNQVLSIFNKPFKGEYALLNFFDHDLPFQWNDFNGFQLTWWNTHAKPNVDGHNGVDWLVPDGTPLLAVVDGKITRSGVAAPFYCPTFGRNVNDSLGVDIQYDASNGERYRVSYSHMSRADVALGQTVRTGQQIGLSGHSGCTTIPHVHFYIERNFFTNNGLPTPVDPYGWEGSQADPWQQNPEGAQSLWLWRDNEAPAIFRNASRATNSNPGEAAPVAITLLRWTGWKDDIRPNNEFVQLELDSRYAPSGTYDLTGFSLKNNHGDSFKIPNGTIIKQNVPIHIFTGSGTNTATNLYWGLSNGIWDDMGDCAHLVKPDNSNMYKLNTMDTSCN